MDEPTQELIGNLILTFATAYLTCFFTIRSEYRKAKLSHRIELNDDCVDLMNRYASDPSCIFDETYFASLTKLNYKLRAYAGRRTSRAYTAFCDSVAARREQCFVALEQVHSRYFVSVPIEDPEQGGAAYYEERMIGSGDMERYESDCAMVRKCHLPSNKEAKIQVEQIIKTL